MQLWPEVKWLKLLVGKEHKPQANKGFKPQANKEHKHQGINHGKLPVLPNPLAIKM